MSINIRPAADFSATDLADLFRACFADYFVPLHVTPATIESMHRRDSVDLARSCVVERAGGPAGFMLLAFRGRGARIAAMGVMAEARRAGIARRMLDHAESAARTAACAELILEVITANDPAVRLYESAGFRRVTTLHGFTLVDSPTAAAATGAGAGAGQLVPTDAQVVADWIKRHGETALPWQLSAETIAAPLPGHTAYEWKDRAACLITDPSQERIAILSLVISRERRRRGIGRAVQSELMRLHPGRTWRVPEIVPEGEATAFLLAGGWQPSAIRQFLMTKPL